ncbi:glycosyltransferase [Verminephrobacter aporrectodeae]|uniref:glycosyltransferase n=1 Tax=Verminephrobacter aporrectodeae TaxID=1110389 RepID=UPI00224440DE|nr:glycosyltransferase [Verminephrobacter aporrectodeae]MCW8176998.1 glycosyltransferase [Verminephrobacter aporrectodeae subsp. tuberculatae]MCW8204494.1 glycosyltransferase [Verminephrobacter aporrectodeae subsp. tuberculatae]
MHVLLVNNAPIPVYGYGGTERVIWDLGRTLVQLGHRVSYLVPQGSHCEFGQVLLIRPDAPWDGQIPADVDIAHFQFHPRTGVERPHLMTEHGNARKLRPLPLNTVFLSRNHAARHGSTEFVYNGLDWDSYGPVDFDCPRPRHHFLGKAAWGVKNVRGAIRVARFAGVDLDVLGGTRISFCRGFRWTLSRSVHFHGMVGGARKTLLLNMSRGLILPVRWHEPFGLAVIESLYFGCPVFSTPYGSLPELVPLHCGVLSAQARVLAEAVRDNRFDPRACHAHVLEHFGARRMARDYLRLYERVLAGESIHTRHPVIQDPARALPWMD